MGFFDNVFKQIDNGLKIIESGELEKALDKIAGTVEEKSKQVDRTLLKVADKPSELLKTAEQKAQQAERTVSKATQPLRRKIDI